MFLPVQVRKLEAKQSQSLGIGRLGRLYAASYNISDEMGYRDTNWATQPFVIWSKPYHVRNLKQKIWSCLRDWNTCFTYILAIRNDTESRAKLTGSQKLGKKISNLFCADLRSPQWNEKRAHGSNTSYLHTTWKRWTQQTGVTKKKSLFNRHNQIWESSPGITTSSIYVYSRDLSPSWKTWRTILEARTVGFDIGLNLPVSIFTDARLTWICSQWSEGWWNLHLVQNIGLLFSEAFIPGLERHHHGQPSPRIRKLRVLYSTGTTTQWSNVAYDD